MFPGAAVVRFAGGSECMLYGTVMGAIGALLPFTSREDVDFFTHLEMHLRQEHPPLCGRDHMAYRSAYFPVKVQCARITRRGRKKGVSPKP